MVRLLAFKISRVEYYKDVPWTIVGSLLRLRWTFPLCHKLLAGTHHWLTTSDTQLLTMNNGFSLLVNSGRETYNVAAWPKLTNAGINGSKSA